MAGLLTIERMLSVAHGGEVTCACRIKNTGTVVDQYSVQVMGAAAGWTVAEPPSLSLFPGSEGVITLRMRPPETISAGSVPFAVKLQSAADPAATVVEEGSIAVGAFVAVTARLVPRVSKGRAGGKHKLIVKNTGNTPARVRVNGSDPDDVIRFRGLAGAPFVLAPNGRQELKVRYRSTASHMTGPPENHEFTVSVVPDGGEPVPVKGALLQKAAISGWVPKLVVAVVAIVLLVLIFKAVSTSAPQTAAKPAGAGALVNSTASPSASAGATPTPTPAATPTPSGGGGGVGGTSPGSTPKPTPTATPPPTPPPTTLPPGVVQMPFIYTHSGSILMPSRSASSKTLVAGVAGRWSPDGKSLLYYSGGINVAAYDATTQTISGAHLVVTSSACNCYGDWSPKGDMISFTHGMDLSVIKPDGTGSRVVAAGVNAAGWVGWSPDETVIFFASTTEAGGAGIYAVPVAGGSATRLASLVGGSTTGVSVRPDGVQIAWTDGGRLRTADLNTTTLTITNIQDAVPTGASDVVMDRTLSLAYFTDSTGNIRSYNLKTKVLTPVTTDGSDSWCYG